MAKPILVYKTKQRLTLYQIDQLKQAIQSKCEDWLVLVADNMDTNDVVGLMPDGVRHAQAQAFIDSRWQWLKVGDKWEVYTTGQDNFTPDKTWNVNDYYESRFADIMNRME